MNSGLVIDIQKDLNWLYRAPPLLSSPHAASVFSPSQYAALASEAVCQQTLPNPPAYRLGKHFESVVELLFASSPDVKLLAHSLPISHNKTTLGEIDFLYRNPMGESVHLEVAIKFYLMQTNGSELCDFIGPNGNDRLDKKWHRLLEHQLPLTQTTAAEDTLLSLGLPIPSQHEILLTGYLFYPIECQKAPDISILNPNHLKGWWCHQKDIAAIDKPDQFFFILPRYYWIAGVAHMSAAEGITFEQLVTSLSTLERPCMVVVTHEKDGVITEKNRGFIVPDGWPN